MATIITQATAASTLDTVAPKVLPRIRFAIVLAVLATMPDPDEAAIRQIEFRRQKRKALINEKY